MLLVIFVLLVIIGIFLIWVNNKFCPPDWVEPVAMFTTVIGGVCAVISIFIVIIFALYVMIFL